MRTPLRSTSRVSVRSSGESLGPSARATALGIGIWSFKTKGQIALISIEE